MFDHNRMFVMCIVGSAMTTIRRMTDVITVKTGVVFVTVTVKIVSQTVNSRVA